MISTFEDFESKEINYEPWRFSASSDEFESYFSESDKSSFKKTGRMTLRFKFLKGKPVSGSIIPSGF